jgi:hypothetical protein
MLWLTELTVVSWSFRGLSRCLEDSLVGEGCQNGWILLAIERKVKEVSQSHCIYDIAFRS